MPMLFACMKTAFLSTHTIRLLHNWLVASTWCVLVIMDLLNDRSTTLSMHSLQVQPGREYTSCFCITHGSSGEFYEIAHLVGTRLVYPWTSTSEKWIVEHGIHHILHLAERVLEERVVKQAPREGASSKHRDD